MNYKEALIMVGQPDDCIVLGSLEVPMSDSDYFCHYLAKLRTEYLEKYGTTEGFVESLEEEMSPWETVNNSFYVIKDGECHFPDDKGCDSGYCNTDYESMGWLPLEYPKKCECGGLLHIEHLRHGEYESIPNYLQLAEGCDKCFKRSSIIHKVRDI